MSSPEELISKARYAIQIRPEEPKTIERILHSILTREYGLIDPLKPGRSAAFNKEKILLRERWPNREEKPQVTISGPYDTKDKLEGYLEEALGEYLKIHDEEPIIRRNIRLDVEI